MEEQFQFNRAKFKDVVHYAVHFATTNFDAMMLGNTKLHKILYYCDMLQYLQTGRPLTGSDYLRQRFGPTSRFLGLGLKELKIEGRIFVGSTNYYGYNKAEYQSLEKPDTGRLSRDEIDLIEHIAKFVCAHTAVEISEFTHDDVWASVPMGERIPYYAAFAMFPAEITDEDVEDATQELTNIVPLIEAQRRNGSVL